MKPQSEKEMRHSPYVGASQKPQMYFNVFGLEGEVVCGLA